MEEENFGLMDQAYFVGKKEVLAWVNKVTQANVERIEQLGTGAVHCQLIDAFYEKVVPLSKVNWKARADHEFIHNLRLMQKALVDLKFNKKVDIEKLAKAKYQDNLEFAQWIKKILEPKTMREDYDPVARRNGEELYFMSEKEKKALERPPKEVVKEEPVKKPDLPRKPAIPHFGKRAEKDEKDEKESKKDEKEHKKEVKEHKKDEKEHKKEETKKSTRDLTSATSSATTKKEHKPVEKKEAKPVHVEKKEPKHVEKKQNLPPGVNLEELLQCKEEVENLKELLSMDMDAATLLKQLREHFGIVVEEDAPAEEAHSTHEEHAEEKSHDHVEEHVEDHADKHVEKKVEEHVEEKVEKKVEEKVEAKVEEHVEEHVEEKVEEHVEEHVQEHVEVAHEEKVEETHEAHAEESKNNEEHADKAEEAS